MFLKSLNNRVGAPEKSIHVNIGSIWDCFDPLMVWVDVKAKDLKKSWPWIFLKCTQNINWLKRIFQWRRVSRWHLSPSQQGPKPLLQPSFQSDLCKKKLWEKREVGIQTCAKHPTGLVLHQKALQSKLVKDNFLACYFWLRLPAWMSLQSWLSWSWHSSCGCSWQGPWSAQSHTLQLMQGSKKAPGAK